MRANDRVVAVGGCYGDVVARNVAPVERASLADAAVVAAGFRLDLDAARPSAEDIEAAKAAAAVEGRAVATDSSLDVLVVDEDGNLIDPRELEDYDPATRRPEGIDAPDGNRQSPAPAVDPEFLDRAINGTRRPPPAGQAPPSQPGSQTRMHLPGGNDDDRAKIELLQGVVDKQALQLKTRNDELLDLQRNHVSVQMCVCVRVCWSCVHNLHARMHACMHARTRVRARARAHTHTHTHTCTYT